MSPKLRKDSFRTVQQKASAPAEKWESASRNGCTPTRSFYNYFNFVRQLSSGSSYHHLRPAISICVRDRLLFKDVANHPLSFRLRCDQQDLVFTNDLVFHTLELPKYTVPGDNALRGLPELEKWFCFFEVRLGAGCSRVGSVTG